MFRTGIQQVFGFGGSSSYSLFLVPTRDMATLKDISQRLKSIKNIQKITKSMKMVSAAKYARAERDLKPARPYGEGAQVFYDRSGVSEVDKKPEHLIVLMSSDRGLCGAVHSNIGRQVKHHVDEKPAERNIKFICVGDKMRAIISRFYAKNILLTCNEYGKKPPTFEDASIVAQAILRSGYNFDQGEIYYNYFRSVVSYKTRRLPIFNFDTVSKAEKISEYDSLDGEVIQSYLEYSLASLIYYAMKEGACSEQSARMTAMDAASKNAGEMIDKLTLHFNRTRQAVITRELIEIISGAAAL